MRTKNPQTTCKECEGTGTVDDQAQIGAAARLKRKRAGVSLRSVARAMAVSAPYLSDLELGRRTWSTQRIARFKVALVAVAAKSKGTN